jgi:hypothetical protein
VVVAGSKFGQGPPFGVERRHPVEHPLDIAQLFLRHIGGRGGFDD